MEASSASVPARAGAGRSAAAKLAAAWILLPLFFLVTGGSPGWWQSWAYCVVLLAPASVFVAFMARRDPAFLERRTRLREKEKTQRWILALGLPFFLAGITLPGLDRRFGWSDPPLAVEIAALAAVFLGYLVVVRVFLENRWAGRTVETFEGQQVISTGPYAIVRHPMYAGTILLYLATPLALGSWWALLPMLAFLPVFVVRILNEEAVLVRALPGYEAYRGRVRSRLVPFLW